MQTRNAAFVSVMLAGLGCWPVMATEPVRAVSDPNIEIRALPSALISPMPSARTEVDPRSSLLVKSLSAARASAVANTYSHSALVGKSRSSSKPNGRGEAFSIKPGPSAGTVSMGHSPPSAQKLQVPSEELRVRLRGDGTARWINANTSPNGATSKPGGAGIESEKLVRDFLGQHRPLLGIRDPAREFTLVSHQVDVLGFQQLRFQQVYRDIPVWGAQLLAQISATGELDGIGGAYTTTPRKVITKPSVDVNLAIAVAGSVYDTRGRGSSESKGLVIVAHVSPIPRLAWEVEVVLSDSKQWTVFVDAHSAEIITGFSRIYTENVTGAGTDLYGNPQPLNVWQEDGLHFLIDTSKPMYDSTSVPLDIENTRGAIYVGDLANTESTPSFILTLDGPNGSWLADGVSGAASLSTTYDYFLSRHGRDSFDGAGRSIIALVRQGQNVFNASFDPTRNLMLFGDADRFPGALDVVAHEFTHGVVFTSANLMYQNQSGALNEAFADIFGEMVEAAAVGQPDWLVGSGLASPFRSMSDPGSIEAAPGIPYPARHSEFIQTTIDNGGVHLNSSIINHAFYQLAVNLPVAIGAADAADIFYRTLTTKLTPLSDFYDARFGAILSAEELFGESSPQAGATAAAFDYVEIFEVTGNPLPPPITPINGPDSTLFTYRDPVSGAFLLGRLEPGVDPQQGTQLAVEPIAGSRASVRGDGELAIFVNEDFDACLILTSGLSPEECIGVPGQVASVAMAPDGETFGFVLLDAQGDPTNRITVVDLATETTVDYILEAPLFDGVSDLQVIQADAMDFTNDSRYLVYDAFNVANFGDSGILGLWSIYAIDLLTGTTIPLIPPTPGFHTAYPSIAQTSDGHMTFDAYDRINDDNTVVAGDVYTGTLTGIASTNQNFSIPSYTGDDSGIVFMFEDAGAATGMNLWQVPVAPDRITPAGDPQLWLLDAAAGAIYRRGTFQEPERVDLEATMTASAESAHIAIFAVGIRNNSEIQASNSLLSFSFPSNVQIADFSTDTAGCDINGEQLLCTSTSLLPGATESTTVRVELQSYSAGGTVTVGAATFGEQTDADERNNSAFAEVLERDLNGDPTLQAPITDQTVTAGQAASFAVSASFSDPDDDPLTYMAAGLPSGLSIAGSTGVISGTPSSSSVAGSPYTVDVSATDSFGDAAVASFEVDVNAAPPPPPPPASSGGGGGSVGLLFILVGLLGLLPRRRRRTR